MENVNRSQFITRSAKGGLVLVAGGSVLALAACGDDDDPGAGTTAPTTTAPQVSDTDIAKLAATAELLAIDFYGQAIDTGGFTGDVLAYMQAARQNEQDHYDALAAVLKDAAPKDLMFTYPEGTFESATSIAETGAALETAFVGAYMGAVTALTDNELKKVAALVGANEAQHLAVFKQLAAGMLVPNPALPDVLTAAQATEAVQGFLA
jgi:rubrerythrin